MTRNSKLKHKNKKKFLIENLFKKLCPGEDWLPPMPEPGDIIFPSDSQEKTEEDSAKPASESESDAVKTQHKET